MNFVIVLAGLIGCSSQAEWSYDYETRWPGVCRTGSLQSPINIMSRSALVDLSQVHLRGPLLFRGYGDVPLSAENTGHTLQWNTLKGAAGAGAPVLAGGPLRGNYTFMQFHLHWLSEHAIDGMKYPLEIHLVHIKTGLTVEEATQRADGIAVVGVLCQVRSEPESNQALADIMPAVPLLLKKTVQQTEPMNVNLLRLLSGNLQSYYTYHGSLTTPSCDEVVTWIVMDVPIHISDTQYKELSRVNIGGVDNYRSLQAANRVVYRSRASCRPAGPLGLVGALAGLLHCLSSSLAGPALAGPVLAGARRGMCVLWDAKHSFINRGPRQIPTCAQ